MTRSTGPADLAWFYVAMLAAIGLLLVIGKCVVVLFQLARLLPL